MRFETSILLLAVSSSGCAITVADGDTGRDGAGGSVEAPAAFCDEVCAKPGADEICFGRDDCRQACDTRADDWIAVTREAFVKCAAETPLCFQTLDQCMLRELNSPDTKHFVRIHGSGFEAYDGKTVRVWGNPSVVSFGADAVIAGGAFAFEWKEAVDIADPLLLVYVDANGDGVCSLEGDVTATCRATWNGDLLEPAFAAEVTPPAENSDFVCETAP